MTGIGQLLGKGHDQRVMHVIRGAVGNDYAGFPLSAVTNAAVEVFAT